MMDVSTADQKRAAIYLRVSTGDDEQMEENQRRKLRAFLEDEGYELAGECVDHESDRMFEAAENRKFDVLVFLRRAFVKQLPTFGNSKASGVGFQSYTEPYLNTENELVSHILLAVMSYFAESKARKINRRTKAGTERAREEGKQIGRPSKFEEHRGEIEEMIEEGASKAEMQRQTGLACGTAPKYVGRIENGAAEIR